MMGERWVDQGALFYAFSLERHMRCTPASPRASHLLVEALALD
jgi:hypothetical protein